MAKKKSRQNSKQSQKTISNRRARHDYNLDDSVIAGIVLTGAETKALRHGRGQLTGAFVTVKEDELWLLNANISSLPGVPIPEDQQTRSRKLLASRKEIDKLISAKRQGNTILPLEILTRGRYIKVRIAPGRGKKLYDKRATLKAREQNREAASAIKSKLR